MNSVILSGRWSKDIDFKALDSGKTVAKSSLAVDDGYGDKKQTYFFDCEMWGKTAEAAANYSGKGKKVLVKGRLKVDSWEKDGQKRYATRVVVEEVEFLESVKKTEEERYAAANETFGHGKRNDDPFVDDGKPIDISDDDLPF